MPGKITRRSFMKQSAVVGAAALFGELSLPPTPAARAASGAAAGLAAVRGTSYFENTVKAVDLVGGMNRCVSKGDRVGLLVNCGFRNFGASARADVVLAVVRMCLDAGAKEIGMLRDPHWGYWIKSGHAGEFKEAIGDLRDWDGDSREIAVKGGVALKKAEVNRLLFECDAFINIPVAKDHAGTNYSGVLKNMMGLCPYSTNRFFHRRHEGKGYFEDVGHLSQCIADLNRVRKPDLVVIDATEILAGNGPYGPGKIVRPQKVVAGTDPVAADAYAASLLGLDPAKVVMLGMAAAHGLGNDRLDKLTIEEVEA